MRSIIFYCIVCAILTSCDPGEITNIPVNPPRLVIQSQPEAGRLWEVYVTRTLPLLDTLTSIRYRPPGVPGATVQLFDGDQFVEDLSATGSDNLIQKFVSSGGSPVPGHTYTIKVEAPGFESVTATYTQPPVVAIDDVKIELTESDVFNESSTFKQISLQFDIDVTFTDPPGDNYYYIALQRSSSPDLTAGDTYVVQEYLYSRLVDYQTRENEGGELFDDRKFAGKQARLSFGTFMSPFLRADTLETPYFFISIRNLSKELYDYRTFIASPGPNHYDPYAQPSLVKTNVRNGLGVFGGFTSDRRMFYYQPR